MDTLKKEYEQVISERKNITEQIKVLAENETVKKYFSLCEQNDRLSKKQRDLYTQIKFGEYLTCNHIWVTALHEYDSWEGRSYNYRGCVKCGLDRRVFHLMKSCHNPEWLTFDQRIMYDFMMNHSSSREIDSNLLCDLDLAKAIYAKIKEVHPDIDDVTAIKYLKAALHNIRDIKVNDERKISRARRLSLKPSFKNWNGHNIVI